MLHWHYGLLKSEGIKMWRTYTNDHSFILQQRLFFEEQRVAYRSRSTRYRRWSVTDSSLISLKFLWSSLPFAVNLDLCASLCFQKTSVVTKWKSGHLFFLSAFILSTFSKRFYNMLALARYYCMCYLDITEQCYPKIHWQALPGNCIYGCHEVIFWAGAWYE